MPTLLEELFKSVECMRKAAAAEFRTAKWHRYNIARALGFFIAAIFIHFFRVFVACVMCFFLCGNMDLCGI
jgi:hypothetical protein